MDLPEPIAWQWVPLDGAPTHCTALSNPIDDGRPAIHPLVRTSSATPMPPEIKVAGAHRPAPQEVKVTTTLYPKVPPNSVFPNSAGAHSIQHSHRPRTQVHSPAHHTRSPFTHPPPIRDERRHTHAR